MKGDFTRITFNPRKHFTRVLMQQGRVQLDADSNEQAAILLHYLQTLAADIIGHHGGPNTPNLGFNINVDRDAGNKITDLKIGVGRYYVDGILCEHEPKVGTDGSESAAISYYGQENYPLSREQKFPDLPFLVYLDVWERHITALEDDEILEVALGGPDTATRAQVTWQVKTLPLRKDDGSIPDKEKISCPAIESEWNNWQKQLQSTNRGLLIAQAKKPSDNGDSQDPCIISPDASYRGAENQLYRVEIHKGGRGWNRKKENLDSAATFKWSRNNGSVVAKWLSNNGNDLIVSGIRDGALGFTPGQWVELTYDALELRGELGTLIRLVKVEGGTLTIDPATAKEIPNPSTLENPKVRCWDQQETGNVTLQNGAVPVDEGAWQDLEDGIQIQFQPSTPGKEPAMYRPDDYWLIPARTITGDVDWPQEGGKPVAVPPNGIEHHYAPLAVISASAVDDCRCKFNQLCTVDTDF